jgi:hypothetical protein
MIKEKEQSCPLLFKGGIFDGSLNRLKSVFKTYETRLEDGRHGYWYSVMPGVSIQDCFTTDLPLIR